MSGESIVAIFNRRKIEHALTSWSSHLGADWSPEFFPSHKQNEVKERIRAGDSQCVKSIFIHA